MNNAVTIMPQDLSTDIQTPAATKLKTFLLNAYKDAPALSALTIFMLALMVPKLGAMLLDTRLHNGINIWIKPIKFDIALSIYTATLIVFARWIPIPTRQKLWFKMFTGAVIVSILYEIFWIGGAAAYGGASHFNIATPLMGFAYTIAGLGSLTLTSAAFVFGVLIFKNKDTGLTSPMHVAIWFGSISMAILTVVTASYMAAQTSHFVGGNMLDVEALPFLGWATDGGDLRVAHFFASHIMHALPVFVIAMSLLFSRVSVAMVIGFATLYSALTIYTLWEAMQGLPFLASIIS